MTGLGVVALLLLAAVLVAFAAIPARQLASGLKMAAPFSLIGIGAILLLAGRAGIAMPLIGFGVALFARNRSVRQLPGTAAPGGSGARSSVRSAMFEMELDHDTGDMDGLVTAGVNEGRWLSSLADEELLEMLPLAASDADSRSLLEAYLDRRMPGWREHAQAHPDPGHARPASSGPMTKQEAYQVLGLEAGAGTQEILEAHRRLMKRLHPDSGGATFLAAKINEAQDTLLG